MSSTINTRFLILSNAVSSGGQLIYKDGPLKQHDIKKALPRIVDCLIYCGSLSENGQKWTYQILLEELQAIPARHKFVIAGRNDRTLDPTLIDSIGMDPEYHYSSHEECRRFWTQDAKHAGIVYLEEGVHTFTLWNGARLNVYASPYSPGYQDGTAFIYNDNGRFIDTRVPLISKGLTSSILPETKPKWFPITWPFSNRPQSSRSQSSWSRSSQSLKKAQIVLKVKNGRFRHSVRKFSSFLGFPEDGEVNREEMSGRQEDNSPFSKKGYQYLAGSCVPSYPAIDIMITHDSPNIYQAHSECDDEVQADGRKALYHATLRTKPKMHCFGGPWDAAGLLMQWGSPNIHREQRNPWPLIFGHRDINFDRRGLKGPTGFGNETLFISAAIEDVDGVPVNKPWLVELRLDPVSKDEERARKKEVRVGASISERHSRASSR